ncbi:MAG: aminopeptidase P family protein [Chlorobi bacterium]|nr:aminopeptidase P family protein [Chlorobiota bacterium]
MSARLKKLRSALRKNGLDGIIISHMPDIHYLSGFSGSAGTLYVTKKQAVLLTDRRYETAAADEVNNGVDVLIDRAHLKRLKDEKLVKKGMTVGFQNQYVSVAAYEGMKKIFKNRVKFKGEEGIVRGLAAIKTEQEVGYIRKAANIAARVYRDILEIVKPGMRENEVAAEISWLGRHYGSEGDAFDIIVASGPRSALPHGRASTKKVKKGELVTLDFGCIYNGFNSDMTRTFALGEPGEEARKIYTIVYNSEREGVRQARAGMSAKELDTVCRQVIDEAGYGDQFSHSTGHGLGIKVHEFPSLSQHMPDEVKLKEGMVVTIEPGIYLEGRFGVRIEDDVVIQKDGCRELTSVSRKLIVV